MHSRFLSYIIWENSKKRILMKTKFVLLFFLAGSAISACGDSSDAKQQRTLREEQPSHSSSREIHMMYFDAPPHIYIDEIGTLTGAVYDFIQEAIAPEMGVTFIWDKETTAIPRQIQVLEQEADSALALLSITPDREKLMAYTEAPYFTDVPAFLLPKANPLLTITSADDFRQLKIGYAKGGYLSPLLRGEDLNMELVSTHNYIETNIGKLRLGRVDAVYAPGASTLVYDIKCYGLEENYKLVFIPDTKSTYYIVFSKLMPEMAELYNAAFRRIDGKKVYWRMLARYIDVSYLE